MKMYFHKNWTQLLYICAYIPVTSKVSRFAFNFSRKKPTNLQVTQQSNSGNTFPLLLFLRRLPYSGEEKKSGKKEKWAPVCASVCLSDCAGRSRTFFLSSKRTQAYVPKLNFADEFKSRRLILTGSLLLLLACLRTARPFFLPSFLFFAGCWYEILARVHFLHFLSLFPSSYY